ncbi:palmitoyltransferase ZDHHC17-like [Iris pallida]|uniref:S-acyltransferase n=1 Tax=Iris pallida TaxID=29817 RepID=A0AAX6GDD8_IRIPA|nr:palmitoyltransferase ZDHHC17-like [Iris pallida]
MLNFCISMEMVKLGFQRRSKKSPWEILVSLLVSFFLFSLCQFALFMVFHLSPSLPLLAMLPISALVLLAAMALGRCWKRILGVSASAPAFVLFNILFLWGVYIVAIRQAISLFFDVVINAECTLLLVAFYRIHSGDPGVVAYGSSSASLEESGLSEVNLQYENSPLYSRVRYCKICKTSVRGFDHHCSAFGNCIGQKNHRLFMVLLIGFVIVEASYIVSALQYITKSMNTEKVLLESISLGNLVISTTLFSLLQLLWQVVFLMWHVYCICANIKSEEWINWKKYPEFQVAVQPHPGNPFSCIKFSNPYNKGIIGNIRDFLQPQEYRPI